MKKFKRAIASLVLAISVVSVPAYASGYDYMISKKYDYVTDGNGKALNGWYNIVRADSIYNRDTASADDSILDYMGWRYYRDGKRLCCGWFKSDDGNWYYLNPNWGSLETNTYVGGHYVDKNGVWRDSIPAGESTWYTEEMVKKAVANVKKLTDSGYWTAGTHIDINGNTVENEVIDYRTSLYFTKEVEELSKAGYPLRVDIFVTEDEPMVDVKVVHNRDLDNAKTVSITPDKFVELFNANKFKYYYGRSGVGGGASGDSTTLCNYSAPYVTDESILK